MCIRDRRNALRADFNGASVRLKKQEAALKEFLQKTGLQNDSTRVQTRGFGRSQAQKAVAADKKIRSFSNDLNGVKTPAGVTVSGATMHFGERAVARGPVSYTHLMCIRDRCCVG